MSESTREATVESSYYEMCPNDRNVWIVLVMPALVQTSTVATDAQSRAIEGTISKVRSPQAEAAVLMLFHRG